MNKQLEPLSQISVATYHKPCQWRVKHVCTTLDLPGSPPFILHPCAVLCGSCVVRWVTRVFLCDSHYTRHWLCNTNLQKRNRTKRAINWVDKSDPITSWPTEISSGSSALWAFHRHQKRSPNKKTHRSANTCEPHRWLPRLKRWGSDVWLQPLGKLKWGAGTPALMCWSNSRIL